MSALARYARKIFIGDVHGCFDELMALLTRIKHDPERDDLFFVGDLVVKGPKSNETVDFIRTTKRSYSVMGNHDYDLLKVAKASNLTPKDLKIPNFAFSRYLGRDPSTMTNHMETAKQLSGENMEYLASMPLYLSPHPKLTVVHAGLIPDIDLQKQNPWNLMNVRNVIERPTPKHTDLCINNIPAAPRETLSGTAYHDLGTAWVNVWNGPSHIFFGHDAKRALQIAAYATGLDTGCCYGGSLTAAIIKCDQHTEDLIAEKNETKYQEEEWEQESERFISESGVVYRLMQVQAAKVYTAKGTIQ